MMRMMRMKFGLILFLCLLSDSYEKQSFLETGDETHEEYL